MVHFDEGEDITSININMIQSYYCKITYLVSIVREIIGQERHSYKRQTLYLGG